MITAEREPAAPPLPDTRSPFARLNELLAGVTPGKPPIAVSVGEPQHPIPPFVGPVLAASLAEFGRYPVNRGIDAFRSAVAAWLGRRYALPRAVDPESEVLVLNGTREGLFLAAITAARFVGPRRGPPAVLIPNPFYAAYWAGADVAGCEPVYVSATAETDFLPDLDRLSEDLLARTVAFYLASPSNPQGAIASRDYLARLTALARRFGFLVLADECYCEIYNTSLAPPGMLEAAGADFANVVVFHSLSKRSNLPGLRSGFCAGDARFLESFAEIRNMVAPQLPGPTQHASAAVWSDEAHVAANRDAYRQKFDVADRILTGRYGYLRPAGGFFLWLDVAKFGGASDATVTLWKRGGVKVLPGAFLAQHGRDGTNPGANYVRLALVHDAATVGEALERFVMVLA